MNRPLVFYIQCSWKRNFLFQTRENIYIGEKNHCFEHVNDQSTTTYFIN